MEAIGKSLGASEAAVGAIRSFNRDVFDAVEAELPQDALQQALTYSGRRLVEAIPTDEPAHYGRLIEDLIKTAPGYATPWFRSLMAVDPAAVYRNVRCPSLFAFGEKDTQIIPSCPRV
jgi:pimeloyl-ACP methyl ester carboxylesterase